MELEGQFRPGPVGDYWVINRQRYLNLSTNETYVILIPFDFVVGGIMVYRRHRMRFSLSPNGTILINGVYQYIPTIMRYSRTDFDEPPIIIHIIQ